MSRPLTVAEEDAAFAWHALREAGVIDQDAPNPFDDSARQRYLERVGAQFTAIERARIRARLGLVTDEMLP